MSQEKNDMDIEEIIVSELKEKKDDFVIPKGGMKIYYANFFPYEMYFSWLGRGEVDQFQRREFSFTLENDYILGQMNKVNERTAELNEGYRKFKE